MELIQGFSVLIAGLALIIFVISYLFILIIVPFYVISINGKARRMEEMMSNFLVLYKKDKDIIELTEKVS